MKSLFSVLLTFIFLFAFGQDNSFSEDNDCGFDKLHQSDTTINVLANIKRMNNNHQHVIIPVVYHLVLNPADSAFITQNDVFNSLNFLNQRFYAINNQSNVRPIFQNIIGNPKIEFCLAQQDPNGNPTNGINRFTTSRAYFNTAIGEWNLMKSSPLGTPSWDATKYVNIWIVDLTGGAAGYAYLPSASMHGSAIDGIVLDYISGFLFSPSILSHEMGHYFGLRHPWGNCISDDGIEQTPFTQTSNFGCNYNRNSCQALPLGPDNPSLWGNVDPPDQIENFMDYSSCSTMFNEEQVDLMRAILDGTRVSLKTSYVCDGVSLPIEGITVTSYSKKYNVYINFKTLSEYNNNGFVLYRSNNGKDFNIVVPFIPTTLSQNYDIIDNVKEKGIYYYKIKSVSSDGIIKQESLFTVKVYGSEFTPILQYGILLMDKDKKTIIKE